MGWIIFTMVLLVCDAVLFLPLCAAKYRRGAYGKFLREAAFIPVILAVLTLAMLYVSVFAELPLVQWQWAEPAFQEHCGEYLSLQATTSKVPESQRHITPGIIVVNKTKKEIASRVCAGLPSLLLAKSPEDVRTVIWLEDLPHMVGQYTDGKPAVRIDCRLAVIDKRDGTILFAEKFEGEAPPKSRSRWTSATGYYPSDKVITYIRRLPRAVPE